MVTPIMCIQIFSGPPDATLPHQSRVRVVLYVRGASENGTLDGLLRVSLVSEVTLGNARSILFLTTVSRKQEDQPEGSNFEQLRRDAERIELI